MQEESRVERNKAPWHLWVVGIVALLWSAGGAFDYVMTQTRNEEYLAAFTEEQREIYRVAHDWVRGMTGLIRPGITCGELAAAAPRIPERYLPQRYEVMVHGVGLEEENPSVCHPQDVQSNPDRVIQENMALVVEIYVGEVGGSVGVKFGDEILVTADGAEILAPYPYSSTLLA